MAKTPFYSFNGGLVSDLFSARVDIGSRFSSGRVVSDFIPTPLGPLVGRSGTIYQGAAYDSSKKIKLIGLNAASATNYVVEMSEYLFRFWKNNALLSGSAKPIASVGGNATVTFLAADGSSLGTGEAILVVWASHGLTPGTAVSFTTTGTLPGGLVPTTIYYVSYENFFNDSFSISTVPYGAASVADATAGVGTHTGYHSVIATTTANNFRNDDVISINNNSGVTGLAAKWAVKNSYCAPVVITSIDSTANTFTLASHGLSTGDKIYFSKTRAGTLPTGSVNITALTLYYAVVVDSSTFKVSVDNDTTSIDLTSTGSGVITMYKVDDEFKNRFQVAPLDGTLDFVPTWTTYNNTSVVNLPYRHTLSTNSQNWRAAGTYTGSGNSEATWYGKHHHYSESVLFDSAGRFDLGYSVLGDSIFLSHNASWPRQLKANSDYDWDFEPHAHDIDYVVTSSGFTQMPYFYDGPYVDQNSENARDISAPKRLLTDVGTVGAVYNKGGNESVMTSSDVGVLLRIDGDANIKNGSWHQVSGVESWTNTNSNTSGADFYAKLKGAGGLGGGWYDLWRKGLLGATEGYPRRVSFAQDRIVYAGYNNYPTRLEMSESSAYDSFSPTDRADYTEVLDSNGISFSIAAQSSGKVVWTVTSDSGIFVGCTGGVYLASGIDSALLTPGGIAQTLASSYGAENIPPLSIGNNIFYVEVGGRRIRMISTGATGIESINSSKLFFDALNSPIIGWEFCRKGVPIIWCYLADGTIVGISCDPREEIFAAFTVDIGGAFSGSNAVVESMTTVRNTDNSDELYFVVKRTVNGGTVRYIERLADSIFFDAGVTKANAIHVDSAITVTNAPASTTVSGLSHLEGQAVDVVADGVVITGKTVSSGAITLSTAASSIIVGLSYRPAWESLDVESRIEQGVSLGSVKRMHKIDLGFYKTLGAKVGRSSSYMNEISFGAVTTTNVALFTGPKEAPFNGDHTAQPRVRVEQVYPMPICIQYIVIEGEGYG